jgi:hypothetical protein
MKHLDNLGTLLAEEVMNEPGICFYPARFKTPHKGHWEAVRDLTNRNYIKKVVILISPKEVDGITQEDSYKIWKIFQEANPNPKIQIQKSTEDSPVKDVYAYLKQHPLDKAVYLAYNTGEDDDPGYVESLQKQFGDKVKGIPVDDKSGEITSPRVRDMLSAGDIDGYLESLPDAVKNKGYGDDIFKLVAPHAKDTLNEDALMERFENLDYKQKLQAFVDFVADGLGIQNKPTLQYEESLEFTQRERSFGGFVPEDNKIIVVVGNRNLADVMRSLAHELVHVRQNEETPLTAMQGETGSEIENQANAVAGVIMRLYGKNNPEIYMDWISAR